MKRPAFTPVDIGITNPDAAGAVVLHLKDANGNDQLVPLTPGLRASLGQRLMSEPLANAIGTQSPALLFAPTKTRAYVRQDGDLAIELQIGGNRAVHVLLRGLHADALVAQIQEVRSPVPGNPIQ
jgi:hypothetical protein